MKLVKIQKTEAQKRQIDAQKLLVEWLETWLKYHNSQIRFLPSQQTTVDATELLGLVMGEQRVRLDMLARETYTVSPEERDGE